MVTKKKTMIKKKVLGKKTIKPNPKEAEIKNNIKKLEKEYNILKNNLTTQFGKIKIKYSEGKAIKKIKSDVSNNLKKMALLLENSAKKLTK
ncbi:MAG: hypothetical protein WC376_01160 [Candidatus Nanoarchaeia archaeon]|jgi:hypothetical protein